MAQGFQVIKYEPSVLPSPKELLTISDNAGIQFSEVSFYEFRYLNRIYKTHIQCWNNNTAVLPDGSSLEDKPCQDYLLKSLQVAMARSHPMM